MSQIVTLVNTLVAKVNREEEGQGLVEYALIIALVSVVLVVSLQGLQGGIAGAFGNITGSL